MNGEEFYLEFKNALNAVGAGWQGMSQVNVKVGSEGDIWLQFEDRMMGFKVPWQYAKKNANEETSAK